MNIFCLLPKIRNISEMSFAKLPSKVHKCLLFLTFFCKKKQWQHWTSKGFLQILFRGDFQKAERPSLNLCDQRTFPLLNLIWANNTWKLFCNSTLMNTYILVFIARSSKISYFFFPAFIRCTNGFCARLNLIFRAWFPTILVPLFVKERKLFSVSIRNYIQFHFEKFYSVSEFYVIVSFHYCTF